MPIRVERKRRDIRETQARDIDLYADRLRTFVQEQFFPTTNYDKNQLPQLGKRYLDAIERAHRDNNGAQLLTLEQEMQEELTTLAAAEKQQPQEDADTKRRELAQRAHTIYEDSNTLLRTTGTMTTEGVNATTFRKLLDERERIYTRCMEHARSGTMDDLSVAVMELQLLHHELQKAITAMQTRDEDRPLQPQRGKTSTASVMETATSEHREEGSMVSPSTTMIMPSRQKGLFSRLRRFFGMPRENRAVPPSREQLQAPIERELILHDIEQKIHALEQLPTPRQLPTYRQRELRAVHEEILKYLARNNLTTFEGVVNTGFQHGAYQELLEIRDLLKEL